MLGWQTKQAAFSRAPVLRWTASWRPESDLQIKERDASASSSAAALKSCHHKVDVMFHNIIIPAFKFPDKTLAAQIPVSLPHTRNTQEKCVFALRWMMYLISSSSLFYVWFWMLKKQKQNVDPVSEPWFSSKTTAYNGLSGPKRICTNMLWTVSFSCSGIFVHNSTRNRRGGGALGAPCAPWGEVRVEEKQVITPIPSPENLHKQATRHEPLTTMTTAPSCCRRKSRV